MLQFAVAASCLVAGLAYPTMLALANIRTFDQVSDTGRATDPTIYNPPTFAIVATLIFLPIGVIVGFVTATEAAAIRRRNRKPSAP